MSDHFNYDDDIASVEVVNDDMDTICDWCGCVTECFDHEGGMICQDCFEEEV